MCTIRNGLVQTDPLKKTGLVFIQLNSAGYKVNSAYATLAIENECRYRSPMIDWSSCPGVERDRDKVSGSWVFRDTRVPVIALFENLEGGASLGDFLLWFPGVTKEQVEAVLEYTIQSLKAGRQAA